MPHSPMAKKNARLELASRAYVILVAQFAALRGVDMRVDGKDDGTFAVRGTWLEAQNILRAGTVMDSLSKAAAELLVEDIKATQ